MAKVFSLLLLFSFIASTTVAQGHYCCTSKEKMTSQVSEVKGCPHHQKREQKSLENNSNCLKLCCFFSLVPATLGKIKLQYAFLYQAQPLEFYPGHTSTHSEQLFRPPIA